MAKLRNVLLATNEVVLPLSKGSLYFQLFFSTTENAKGTFLISLWELVQSISSIKIALPIIVFIITQVISAGVQGKNVIWLMMWPVSSWNLQLKTSSNQLKLVASHAPCFIYTISSSMHARSSVVKVSSGVDEGPHCDIMLICTPFFVW